MFLRKIQLQHWGCHDALSIDLTPGVNVCIGPNGTGKSTLYQAILAALTVKHTAKGEEIRALQSWGTDGAGPRAILELVRVDGPWRLTKQFLHEPSCSLEAPGGSGGWTVRKKSKVAETELETWLESDGAAGRLIVALWSPQDDPTRIYEATARAGKESPATALERVLERVARPEASGPFANLKKAVEAQYAAGFTPIDALVRKHSELDRARRDRDAAAADLGLIADRQRESAAKIADYRERLARLEADRGERDALHARRADRDRLAAEFRVQAEALGAAEALARISRETFERDRQGHTRLVRADDDLAHARVELDDLGRRSERLARARDAAEAALAATLERHSEATTRLDKLAPLYEEGRRLDETQARVDDRRERLRRASEAEERSSLGVVEASNQVDAARVRVDQATRLRDAADRARRRRARDVAETRWVAAEDEFRRAEAGALARERSELRALVVERDDLQGRLDQLNPAGDGGPVPTTADFAGLRRLDETIRAQAEVLEADSLTLRLEAERPLVTGIASDGEIPIDREVTPGTFLESRGVSQLVLTIEGVGRIAIGRTSVEPGVRRERLEADRRRLADHLRAWQADGVEALEARRRRAEERASLRLQIQARLAGRSVDDLQARRSEIDRDLEALGVGPVDDPVPLGPGDRMDVLRGRRDEAAKVRAAAIALCPEAVAGPLESDAGTDAIEAERRLAEASSTLKAAELAADSAMLDRADALAERKAARATLDDAERELCAESAGEAPDARRIQLEELIAEHEEALRDLGIDVDEARTRVAVQLQKKRLDVELQSRRRARDEAEAARAAVDRDRAGKAILVESLGERRDEIAADVPLADDPEARAAAIADREETWRRDEARVDLLRGLLPPDPIAADPALEGRCDELDVRCHRGDLDLAGLRGELDTRGAEGLDSRRVSAEERLAACVRRCEHRERDAAAWALLRNLLNEVEADQARGVAARIEALADDLVPRLTARHVRGVTLDPTTLAPAGALPDALDVKARIDRFSRGTREQVALACRLQIGLLLGQESRQMLLLDDPLAHTDPDRHREALLVLAELAEHLQVIIFTCHRDRYEPLWTDNSARRIEIGSRELTPP